MTTIWQIWQNLPDESYAKGKAFEQLAKWFFQNDPHWNKILKPESIKLWHESGINWGQDNGIDLTAEGLDGSIWAIQAKAWNPNTLLTKSAVDSFLAESSRITIDKRIIITTAKEISKPLKQSIEGQEKPVQIIKGIDLMRSLVDWSNCPYLFKSTIPKIRNDKERMKQEWREVRRLLPWLIALIFVILGIFLIFDNDEVIEVKTDVNPTASQPPQNVEKTPIPISRELPDGYTEFNANFAYKWIQELPENVFYNNVWRGVYSEISIAYLGDFACSPTLPDGVTNQIQVSVLATTADDRSSTGRGFVSILGDDSGLYKVSIQYLKLSKDSVKLIKDVVVIRINCRM